MARQKRMSQREKAERARIKKQLQAEGRLPLDKPRLNRKKFIQEALDEYDQEMGYTDLIYLKEAIGTFLADVPPYSAEQVGAAKVLKIAVETKRFMEKLKRQGEKQYSVRDYVEQVVLPIERL